MISSSLAEKSNDRATYAPVVFSIHRQESCLYDGPYLDLIAFIPVVRETTVQGSEERGWGREAWQSEMGGAEK